MTPLEWFIFLFAAGLVLLVAELLLPTHGIVGAAGVISLLVGIGFCFAVNPWLGLGVLAASMAATPFVWALALKIFPKTPVGRVLVLPPVENPVPVATVQMGQTGVAISELRPVGTCEFDGERIEAISEHGIIPAGKKVQVVNLSNRRPTVRVV